MKIGIVGFGGRLSTVFIDLLNVSSGDVKLTAVTEIKTKEEQIKLYPNLKEHLEKANYYADIDQMLDNESLDGVMVGTNCSTHSKFAKKVIDKGLALFLEKPTCINLEQYKELESCLEKGNLTTVVSFPLRLSNMIDDIKDIISRGTLGKIQHVLGFNYVPYGSVYYQGWYRNDKETGGLFLQKFTHDFDYINYILEDTPSLICAMESKQIFKGEHDIGLDCNKCSDKATCKQTPEFLKNCGEVSYGSACAFAKDTGNHDSASVLIKYESGMHLVYTQNFFVKKKSAKRGAIFSGFEATLEFDWYTNEIKVYHHFQNKVDCYKYDNAMAGHFGGDEKLARSFYNIIKNKASSVSPLKAGLDSAKLCILAKKSAENNSFESWNI